MTAPIVLRLRDPAAVFEGPLARIVFDHAILAPSLHANVVAGAGWHRELHRSISILTCGPVDAHARHRGMAPAMLATEPVGRRDPQRKRSLHGKNARPR